MLVVGLDFFHAGCRHAVHDQGGLADELHVLSLGAAVLDALLEIVGDVGALGGAAAAEDAGKDHGGGAGLEEGEDGDEGDGGDLGGIHF